MQQERKGNAMNRKSISAAAVMAALVMWGAVAANAAGAEFKRPITLSHRGANKAADENTMEAYALSVRHGMDFIECDPRFTSDGELVIMHDSTVDRTTSSTGAVSEKTLAEIKSIRTKNGYKIPTFDEVLDFASKNGVKVFIDTKLHDEDYLARVLAAVREKGMADRVVMGLWTEGGLKWMSKNNPDIACNLPWPAPVPSLKQIKKLGSSWVGMLAEGATPEVIAEAHSVRLRVVTMPINDVPTMVEKIQAGMHVIQTDNPALLDAVLGAMSWAASKGSDPKPLLPFDVKNAMPSIAERQRIQGEVPDGFTVVPRLVFLTGHIGPPDAIAVKPGRASVGDGSFAKPTTLAVNPDTGSRKIPYGTMIYIPGTGWTKAEDRCGKCVEEGDVRHRADLWLGNGTPKEKAYELTGWHWTLFAEPK
jgi:glycerophosphoryl diester phosphodiesterase